MKVKQLFRELREAWFYTAVCHDEYAALDCLDDKKKKKKSTKKSTKKKKKKKATKQINKKLKKAKKEFDRETEELLHGKNYAVAPNGIKELLDSVHE